MCASFFSFFQAYSLVDREVGYCQGSAFIVGLLLMQVIVKRCAAGNWTIREYFCFKAQHILSVNNVFIIATVIYVAGLWKIKLQLICFLRWCIIQSPAQFDFQQSSRLLPDARGGGLLCFCSSDAGVSPEGALQAQHGRARSLHLPVWISATGKEEAGACI